MEKKCFLAISFVLLLFLCLNASAKSYTLDKAEVYYKILPDGMVEAREEITFDFSGDFSFAYRDIPKGQWRLSEVGVYDITSGKEELYFTTLSQGNDTRIRWD